MVKQQHTPAQVSLNVFMLNLVDQNLKFLTAVEIQMMINMGKTTDCRGPSLKDKVKSC